MRGWVGLALAGALAALPMGRATAGVVYSLDETTFGSPGFQATLTWPTFISTETQFPVSDFSVSNNPSNFDFVEFAPNTSSIYCSDFGLGTCDLITLGGLGFSPYGYEPGTFSTTGTNTATVGGFSMKLTISETSVPEPSAVALFATGLLGLGMVLRRRA